MKKKISSLFMVVCMTAGCGVQSNDSFPTENQINVQTENVQKNESVEETESVTFTTNQTSESSFEFDSAIGSITKFIGNEKDVIIPEKIGGVNVLSIGESAFEACKNLKLIEIPNSVTSIGEDAFYCCRNLTSVEIPNSVTSIGEWAFHTCDSLIEIKVSQDNVNYSSENGVLFNKAKSELLQYPQGKPETKYIIPDSVTSIGKWAFEGCDNLVNVEIPNSVISIGISAFERCDNLINVEIPDSVTSIGDYAFSHCNITSVTIPDSVTSIGESTFSQCPNLKTLQVHSGSYAESYAKKKGIECKTY